MKSFSSKRPENPCSAHAHRCMYISNQGCGAISLDGEEAEGQAGRGQTDREVGDGGGQQALTQAAVSQHAIGEQLSDVIRDGLDDKAGVAPVQGGPAASPPGLLHALQQRSLQSTGLPGSALPPLRPPACKTSMQTEAEGKGGAGKWVGREGAREGRRRGDVRLAAPNAPPSASSGQCPHTASVPSSLKRESSVPPRNSEGHAQMRMKSFGEIRPTGHQRAEAAACILELSASASRLCHPTILSSSALAVPCPTDTFVSEDNMDVG